MARITSKHSHTVDVKGRMTMPSKFRTFLGETCWVARGENGCLAVYSEEGWDKHCDMILNSSRNHKELIRLQREVFSNVVESTYDKQGRILIPQEFRTMAGITKDVFVIGVGTYAEIWDQSRWNNYTVMDDETFANLIAGIYDQAKEDEKAEKPGME